MKLNKLLLIIGVFVVVLLVLIFYPNPPRTESEPPPPLEIKENSAPIEKMIVYIDASGSMKGYFSKDSDGKFGDAIYKLANFDDKDFNVYFWGNKNKVNTSVDASGGINAALMKKKGFGQATFLNIIFENMVRMIENDSVDVACLVTDGSFGVNNKQTREDLAAATKQLKQYKGDVAKAFRGKKVAAGVYKLSSKFSCKNESDAFIDCHNNPIYPLTIENKPFYVIVIGKPEKVRYFAEKNNLNAELTLNFGTHDIDGHNKCKLEDLSKEHFEGDKWVGNRDNPKTNLTMIFPSCIGDEEYLKKNVKVQFNGNDLKSSDFNISGDMLAITKNLVTDGSVKPGKNYFEVFVKNTIPDKWTSFYCNDDKNIETDQLVQGQTFALQQLLEGMLEGTEPGNGNLMDIKFEFTK